MRRGNESRSTLRRGPELGTNVDRYVRHLVHRLIFKIFQKCALRISNQPSSSTFNNFNNRGK